MGSSTCVMSARVAAAGLDGAFGCALATGGARVVRGPSATAPADFVFTQNGAAFVVVGEARRALGRQTLPPPRPLPTPLPSSLVAS